MPIQNGTITCKTKDGKDFTTFDNVPSGTSLTFTLTANQGFSPVKLVIDGTEYKTLNAEGNISQEITVVKAFEVSGECTEKNVNAKHKITITQPKDGTITCTKEDGSAIENLNEVPQGTKVKVLLKANEKHHAKMLKIAEEEVKTEGTDKTQIEKLWTVQQDISISGECVAYFLVTIKTVENGTITCKNADRTEIKGDDLKEVEKGTKLKFTLRATDAAFVARKLTIDDAEYTEVVDGAIVAEIDVAKAHVVSGTVGKLTLELRQISFLYNTIEPIVRDT